MQSMCEKMFTVLNMDRKERVATKALERRLPQWSWQEVMGQLSLSDGCRWYAESQEILGIKADSS